MILNSFSELNATACPRAFQELNGLTILVPSEDQANPPTSSPPQTTFPSVPLPVEPDFAQGEDLLLKALQSPPFPNVARGATDHANSNDVLRYLNLVPGESDAETVSKFSAESSSSRELPLPPLTPNLYPEKRGLSISDVCGRTEPLKREPIGQPKPVGTKRKAASSSSSSKRAKVTQTSKFCHVCVRSGEQVTLVPCANVVGAVCRKAVCHRCFEKHGYTHEWANACKNREIIRQIHAGLLDRLPENVWTCLHCRSICPSSAQCKIYARTNKRRHLILKQRKAERDRLMAQQNDINRQMATQQHQHRTLNIGLRTDRMAPISMTRDILSAGAAYEAHDAALRARELPPEHVYRTAVVNSHEKGEPAEYLASPRH